MRRSRSGQAIGSPPSAAAEAAVRAGLGSLPDSSSPAIGREKLSVRTGLKEEVLEVKEDFPVVIENYDAT